MEHHICIRDEEGCSDRFAAAGDGAWGSGPPDHVDDGGLAVDVAAVWVLDRVLKDTLGQLADGGLFGLGNDHIGILVAINVHVIIEISRHGLIRVSRLLNQT